MCDTDTVPTATAVVVHCPLCARQLDAPELEKPLYGVVVCSKCRHGLASRRSLAYITDLVIWQVAAIAPLYYLHLIPSLAPAGMSIPGVGAGGVIEIVLMYAVALSLYFKDGFKGMSPGKLVFGVRVVDVDTHEPIGFRRSFKRNICLIVPLAWLVVALTMTNGHRWGDGWAKTRVIWRKYAHNPVFDKRGVVCSKCGYDLTGNTTGRCPECFAACASATPVTAG